MDYRPSTAYNDYTNNRKDGNKGMKRKASTARASSNDEICPFKMAVGYSENGGYYLAVGKGYSHHRGHLPDYTLDKRVSSKHVFHDMIQNLQHLRSANAGELIGGKIFYKHTGFILSRNQVQFISRYSGKTVNLFEGQRHSPKQLIAFFRSSNIQYVSLLNRNKMNTIHE